MLGNPPFYFGTTRRMVLYFGNVFNDITIGRYDRSGNLTQVIKVPISYDYKDKHMARPDNDPELQKPVQVVFPHMGFRLTGFTYDDDRKLNMSGRIVKPDTDANKLRMQYNPVAINYNFELQVFANSQDDALRIVEQIRPMFTPDWTETVELIPEMELSADIPIIMEGSPVYEDMYDGDLTKTRLITWTFNFVLKGRMFGPIHKRKIIKYANTNFYAPSGDLTSATTEDPDALFGAVQVKPGLTANGQPTSNASLSVDANTIFITDDFGFIETVTGNIGFTHE